MFETRQFILAKVIKDEKNNPIKLPCNAQGNVINAMDSAHWMDYPTAVAKSQERGYLVAFVLSEDDPYFCVDIDKALNADGASWSTLANDICYAFQGAYSEVSWSGTGIHIFGRYSNIPPHKCKNTKLNIELYHADRYIILGQNAQGDPEMDCTPQLNTFISSYMARERGKQAQDWTSFPVPEWSGTEDNDALIKLAIASKPLGSNFNDTAVTFEDLWTADADKLAKSWPHGDPYDRSSADMSLAQRLAYWTGKNCQRMQELMMLSELVRDKWTLREDYLTRTILNACAQQTRVYSSPSAGAKGGIDRAVAGGWVGADEFADVFKGCVYVIHDHVALTSEGLRLKPEQFKVIYGGYKFAIDDGRTTRNAWEAFTECPTWRPPTATKACFRPELPPLALVEDGDETLVNIYRPVSVGNAAGDVSRFIKLMEMNYAHKGDREILMSYLAAVVQNPGRKFQWAPLLQGPEGNGKTFIIRAIGEAVGSRYTHTVNAQDLAGNGGKFNSWIFAKLFISIEEIRVGNKFEIMEILKPMITNEKIEVQAKGKDQFEADNRANFIFTSNYMDALALNDDQRRFAPIMSTPQTKQQIDQAGLTREFFSDLWDWARGTGAYKGQVAGFSNITNYLKNLPIRDELNPAVGCVRAPRSSQYGQFAAHSMGRIEQEILECIDEGKAGFRGGFISSTALNWMLKDIRMANRITHPRRREILNSLGYVPHPNIGRGTGRTTSVVMPDGNRPVLFVAKTSLLNQLDSAEAVAKYVETQKETLTGGTGAFGSVVEIKPI
tara:strand:- start:8173 stop:10518 length:2346 start_codon:yes stop_codon:yes gene_type:complete